MLPSGAIPAIRSGWRWWPAGARRSPTSASCGATGITPCSRSDPSPAARTRSACTSRRSAAPWPAIGSTAAGSQRSAHAPLSARRTPHLPAPLRPDPHLRGAAATRSPARAGTPRAAGGLAGRQSGQALFEELDRLAHGSEVSHLLLVDLDVELLLDRHHQLGQLLVIGIEVILV